MLVFWLILLGLLIALFGWVAWRQKRYAGTSPYDRNALEDQQARRSWGLSSQDGKDDPDRP